MSGTKGTRKILLGNMVDYKKVSRLQTGEYFQVNQKDEPRKKIFVLPPFLPPTTKGEG